MNKNRTITIDDTTYVLVPEEEYDNSENSLSVNEKPRTGYERVEEDKSFYHLQGEDLIIQENEEYHCFDDAWYESGNYYNDEQLAENNVRADGILRRMRQWQALNDESVDIYNKTVDKFSIIYNAYYQRLEVMFAVGVIDGYTVYFSRKEKAEEALEIFRDDLTWLHTEYRRRLDEPIYYKKG